LRTSGDVRFGTEAGLQTSGGFELVDPILASAAALVPHRFTLLKDDDVVERTCAFTCRHPSHLFSEFSGEQPCCVRLQQLRKAKSQGQTSQPYKQS
jgi:hypothetical protein